MTENNAECRMHNSYYGGNDRGELDKADKKNRRNSVVDVQPDFMLFCLSPY
jgi:hypothetical protein